MAAREVIIGIDLGTTFSLVAVADERGPRVLRDESGEARVPSVIAMDSGDGRGRPRVGWSARDHAVENPRATVYSIKRIIGRGPKDIAADLPFLAYQVEPGPRSTVQVEIAGRRFSPEELSALVLVELKRRAEQHLGHEVFKAVITVPAYFDDAQRQATRTAGLAAGLQVVRIINEPTAAALAYGLGLRAARADKPAGQNVAVYDLGGGTFDVSILRIEADAFQALAAAGDTHLGGDDLDRAIIQLVRGEVHGQFGLTMDSPAARQALRLLAEASKIRLSDQPGAHIELDLGGGRTYRRHIARAEFEALIAPFVDRTIHLLNGALRSAKLTVDQLDELILVGGSTRIPLVRRRVEEALGRPAYSALNPDEVVALGAAVQAAMLSGLEPDLLLLDVVPLSLGIETMGGAMGKLILRNTTIPRRAAEMFTTFVDGQTAIKIKVLQGERELAADCRTLGEFELRGIPPMPAGLPKVEVEFLVDSNGILNVSARELRSGVAAGIQAVPAYGLTAEEAERIARESVLHAAEDIRAHRRIDLVNQIEFDTSRAEQMLALHGELLSESEREGVRARIRGIRELAGRETDLDKLNNALQEFGRGTRRLAEVGISAALRDAGTP